MKLESFICWFLVACEINLFSIALQHFRKIYEINTEKYLYIRSGLYIVWNNFLYTTINVDKHEHKYKDYLLYSDLFKLVFSFWLLKSFWMLYPPDLFMLQYSHYFKLNSLLLRGRLFWLHSPFHKIISYYLILLNLSFCEKPQGTMAETLWLKQQR